METGVTPKPVLNRGISEGQLRCPICSNRFREPKLLDCSHTFCQLCLQQVISGSKIVCPLCSHKTFLLGIGVAGLPSNFTLSALVEEVTMQEKLLEGQGSEIKCHSCDKNNPAISRCMDCDHFMCHECKRAHECTVVTNSHKIYTLEQLRSEENFYRSKPREHIPKCANHAEESLTLFCNTCEQAVCLTCAIRDHEKHSILRVQDALDKCKRCVAELVPEVIKIKTELNTVIRKTNIAKENLDSMFTDTKRKISQKADQQVAKIKEEEQKLIQEAEKIYEDRVKIFETAHIFNTEGVSQAENKLDEVNQLMTQATCHEILRHRKKLLHNLSELAAKQPERVPDRLSSMDFDEEGEGLLGRLTVDQPEAQAQESQSPMEFSLMWEMKTEIQDFGQPKSRTRTLTRGDIAPFSQNRIVVIHVGKLVDFVIPESRSKSPPVPNDLPIEDFIQPKCIAVNKDDQLLILDKHTVKIFNTHHQLLHQFTPREGSKTEPRCLAVDDNNLIAVGYKEEISLHDPDGSLIRTLPAPGLGNILTIHGQRLIYTNYGSKRLDSLDYSGAMVFSEDLAMQEYSYMWSPTGVCCDSDGSIYVAVYAWPSGDILHYSPDGKFIGCAIKGCSPAGGITVTPAGDLVVVAWNSIKVYQHVTSK